MCMYIDIDKVILKFILKYKEGPRIIKAVYSLHFKKLIAFKSS